MNAATETVSESAPKSESAAKPGRSAEGGSAKRRRAKASKPKREKVSGLDAAYTVLGRAGNDGLQVNEIVERAKNQGILGLKGKTPGATIYAAMSREIADKGKESRFKKVGRGRFARRG